MSPEVRYIFDECAKLTEWALEHKGVCFKDWPRENVLFYLAFHAVCGSLFVVRFNDKVKGLMVAEAMPAADIGRPFSWRSRVSGESVLVQELIGDKPSMNSLFEALKAKYPAMKRIFGQRYRAGRLVLKEFSVPFVERFAHA